MADLPHGGNLDAAMARYGGMAADWLDLSTGVNPNSWPIGDVSASAWQRLPSISAQEQLLDAARVTYHIEQGTSIVAASGTQALLQVLPRVVKAQKVEVLSPTYGEHAHCWSEAGAHVKQVSSIEEFSMPDVAVVVNPNNPDGRQYSPKQLIALANQLDAHGGMLIVDEAFGDVFPELSMGGHEAANLIVLKSFGKFFGLAGMRLGFGICAPKLAAKIHSQLGPWAVNGPALEIGRNALQDSAWIKNNRAWILQQSMMQEAMLKAHGFDVIGNGGLFISVAHERAGEIYEGLCHEYILSRAFEIQSDWLRLGLCKNVNQMNRFDEALTKVIQSL